MRRFAVLPLTLVAVLAACGQGQNQNPTAAPAAGAPAAATEIKAPAGTYKIDPNHASLVFKLQHLGVAPYVARFQKFDATLELDPAHVDKSAVEVTVDPTSIKTDFLGDFVASHKDSPYKTFEEELSRGDKFLNSDKFATIGFKSTKVDFQGGKLRVAGDLTFLGQTHPVTLEGIVTGSMEKHPFTQHGAVGFTATTSIKRSEWGMTGTQQFLGDAVTVEFNGEFHQAAPQEPAPAPAN
jgi:polyisoprenoid-binding protein YceI